MAQTAQTRAYDSGRNLFESCFLRDDRDFHLDAGAERSAATKARDHARTISHRKPLRPLRQHDSSAIRDRVPRLEGRKDLGSISIPLQAAGSEQTAGNLCALSASLEWNLWFASLGNWREYRFVLWTEERLLTNEPDVLELFARNPFPRTPPKEVRSVRYQYWF